MSDPAYDPTHDIDATRADESPQSKPKPVDPENTPDDAPQAINVQGAPPVPPEPGGRPPGVDELLEGGYTHGKDPRDDHEADPAPTPSELTPASGTGTPPPDPKVRDEKTDKEYQRQDKDRDKDNKNTRFALPQDDPKYDPHAHDKPKPKHKD